MKKPFTKSDYKRKRREVKRTSQKLSYCKGVKKFNIGDIVKLKGGEDMGYVERYVYNKIIVKWVASGDLVIYEEGDLVRVV
jgi:hypothetical protein